MLTDRKLLSSWALPTYPQDYEGQIFLAYERGVDQLCPWIAQGGAANIWTPLGYSYVGPLSGLPKPANVRPGAKVLIIEPTPIGGSLVRPPAQGATMDHLELINRYLPDNVTQVWRPNGSQTLFKLTGVVAGPAASYTQLVTSTAEVVTEFGKLPLGLLNTPGTEMWYRIRTGHPTATATAALQFTLGVTSGTVGTPIGQVSTTANVLSNGWMEGSFIVGDTTHQDTTATLTPNASGNTTAVSTTLNLNQILYLQICTAAATAGDVFTMINAEVGIR
jgi:hypothetical protein